MRPEAPEAPGGSRTSDRRELAGVLGLAGLAGLLILVAAGRSWLSVTVQRRPPFGPVRVQLTGRSEFPALSGLAVVALLVAVLVLVTGGWARRLLGLLLALVGISAGWYGRRGFADPGPARLRELLGNRLSQGSGLIQLHRHSGWAALTVVAAGVLVLAGVLVALRAGRWKVGFSTRYAAPAAAAESQDPWRSLDRGEDPTISDR